MEINNYSFGTITVDGKAYNSDIIIFPDHILPNWKRAEGHSLVMEDLTEVINYHPEFLIIGTGASGMLNIPDATKKAIAQEKITLIDQETAEACKTFNEYLKQGKRVVGAFHLTC
jgi:hypothetical protein